MPAIFTQSTGRAAIVDHSTIPVAITMAGWAGTIPAAITGLNVAGQGAYQWLQTLRDTIYVYVFGERMGDLVVSGFAFAGACAGGDSGWDGVFNYYNANRLSMTGKQTSVTFGAGTSVNGFLVGMNLQVIDSSSGLAQFALQFKYPPQGPSVAPTFAF